MNIIKFYLEQIAELVHEQNTDLYAYDEVGCWNIHRNNDGSYNVIFISKGNIAYNYKNIHEEQVLMIIEHDAFWDDEHTEELHNKYIESLTNQ